MRHFLAGVRPGILFKRFVFILFLTGFVANVVQAQKQNQKGKNKEKPPTIEELVASSKKFDGLFTIYQDTITGALQLLVRQNQLDKEFIYFSQVANGVIDAATFRGAYKEAKVFKVTKYFDQLQFEFQNTSFYHDPAHPLSKSSDANISNSIVESEKILASDDHNNRYLIKADHLFLTETLSQVKPAKLPFLQFFSFSLGTLDKKKTRVNAIRSYPKNTDVAVEYVYSKSSVLNPGSKAIADARNVSINIWHSFIEMPENDYQPRYDDPRVGYFTTQINDMTSTSATPYRDLIHRWHLQKKDPDARLSEPVEPITWWIENTTPHNLRPTIKKAGEKWNAIFAAIGYKNAIVIKEQPDSAEWDAGDIQYNVIRWVSSPNPRFSGYGPSFVNPRTGQILGADITLEYTTLSQQLKGEKVFEKAGLSFHGDEGPLSGANSHGYHGNCTFGTYAQVQNQFGLMALHAMGESEFDDNRMIEEYLYFLVLHEMGHTLGLNHNMKASQLHSLADINNPKVTENDGLVGSVMDYPAINFSLDRENQGQYWPTRPGPYDEWAIAYGYQNFENEEALDRLLARSTDSALAFGNDADDMRWPGKAIDPRVNVGDMSNDAINYAVERIKLTREVAEELLLKYQEEGKSFHELRNAYLLLTSQQYNAAHIISRYIGGVYIDRSFAGQSPGKMPFTPVEKDKQKLAMESLAQHVFAADAFLVPNELYNHLQKQRRGYNHFSNPEDPKIHQRVLAIQESVLKHLLHHYTLQRISDSELYGNNYALPTFMEDLNQAIFSDDIKGDVNSFRQNLQLTYTKQVIAILAGKNKDKFSPRSRSMAINNLWQIKNWVQVPQGNLETIAHKRHLKLLIDNALEQIQ